MCAVWELRCFSERDRALTDAQTSADALRTELLAAEDRLRQTEAQMAPWRERAEQMLRWREECERLSDKLEALERAYREGWQQ